MGGICVLLISCEEEKLMKQSRCAIAVGLALFAGAAMAAAIPQVSSDVKNSAEAIYKDPVMQKMLKEKMLNSVSIRIWNWLVLHHLLALKCVVNKKLLVVWSKNGALIRKTSWPIKTV